MGVNENVLSPFALARGAGEGRKRGEGGEEVSGGGDIMFLTHMIVR